MKDRWKRNQIVIHLAYKNITYVRFLQLIHANIGKPTMAITRTIGIAIATTAIIRASTIGIRSRIPTTIEPRTNQRNNGRSGQSLYLQPNIEYFESCPMDAGNLILPPQR